MNDAVVTTRRQPLKLRYRLHADHGTVDPKRAAEISKDFALRPGYEVIKGTKKHYQFEIRRAAK